MCASGRACPEDRQRHHTLVRRTKDPNFVPAAMLGTDEFSHLRIRTDRTFVPKLVNPASQDLRRLGFLLEGLTWQPVEDAHH